MADVTEGMSPREKVMWELLKEVCKRLYEVNGSDYLYYLLSNAETELLAIAEKEEEEERLLDNLITGNT